MPATHSALCNSLRTRYVANCVCVYVDSGDAHNDVFKVGRKLLKTVRTRGNLKIKSTPIRRGTWQ